MQTYCILNLGERLDHIWPSPRLGSGLEGVQVVRCAVWRSRALRIHRHHGLESIVPRLRPGRFPRSWLAGATSCRRSAPEFFLSGRVRSDRTFVGIPCFCFPVFFFVLSAAPIRSKQEPAIHLTLAHAMDAFCQGPVTVCESLAATLQICLSTTVPGCVAKGKRLESVASHSGTQAASVTRSMFSYLLDPGTIAKAEQKLDVSFNVATRERATESEGEREKGTKKTSV